MLSKLRAVVTNKRRQIKQQSRHRALKKIREGVPQEDATQVYPHRSEVHRQQGKVKSLRACRLLPWLLVCDPSYLRDPEFLEAERVRYVLNVSPQVPNYAAGRAAHVRIPFAPNGTLESFGEWFVMLSNVCQLVEMQLQSLYAIYSGLVSKAEKKKTGVRRRKDATERKEEIQMVNTPQMPTLVIHGSGSDGSVACMFALAFMLYWFCVPRTVYESMQYHIRGGSDSAKSETHGLMLPRLMQHITKCGYSFQMTEDRYNVLSAWEHQLMWGTEFLIAKFGVDQTGERYTADLFEKEKLLMEGTESGDDTRDVHSALEENPLSLARSQLLVVQELLVEKIECLREETTKMREKHKKDGKSPGCDDGQIWRAVISAYELPSPSEFTNTPMIPASMKRSRVHQASTLTRKRKAPPQSLFRRTTNTLISIAHWVQSDAARYGAFLFILLFMFMPFMFSVFYFNMSESNAYLQTKGVTAGFVAHPPSQSINDSSMFS